ncbi:MAG: excinuclease ABC subunit UvrC [Alphaproteobacteria bacterium]|nr:excinuclease ABC subunit UvrC [Alphaproteobacteria bacterium]
MSQELPAVGRDIIAQACKTMPSLPGVYRMIDAKGQALYVGKAKDLKKRVTSYLREAGLVTRIMRMIAQTAAMEITVTHTEAEALLLEANLIKKLEPRYNILLRDDKSFPFVVMTGNHDFPRIGKHRGAQAAGNSYFGPFASVGALNSALVTLQKAFLLRPCSDSMFAARTRPCLQYQIKRCSAPCVAKISKNDYAALVGEARAFLTGKSREVSEALGKEMEEASATQEYEYAAVLRDRLKALSRVQHEAALQLHGVADADVVALHREGTSVAVQVFFFRGGQNFGNKAYFPSHAEDAGEGEVLSAFIGQFYQRQEPPSLILLSHDVPHVDTLCEALSLRAERKVTVAVPQRGDKHDAVVIAQSNAREALRRHLAESGTQARLLEGVAELFGLDAPPSRIEVYDNSHTLGTHAVGGMIVAGPEGFIKKGYRKFNMRASGREQASGGDDYAMMREMMTRRFCGLQKDDPGRDRHQWPDLVLIDGGPGQVSAVAEVFATLGIEDVPYIGISKGPDRNAGREEFHAPGKAPFTLPHHDPVLHYLQRLRDEAHRYAIGAHRAKRAKGTLRSQLEDIPGIGHSRKKALLLHFGSAKGVSEATVEELMKVERVNRKMAQEIYNFFHVE